MILELLISVPIFIVIWVMIFKILIKYNKKKLLEDIPGKIAKQDKKFFNDGKEVNFKEALGLEDEETTKEEIKG